jgi:aminocarboxymuconate-semialdehyde decarboxylase
MYWAEDFGSEYARICNDEMSLIAPRTQRTLLSGPRQSGRSGGGCKEIERADSSAPRVCASEGPTSMACRLYEELFPVWETVTRLDVPMMVHGFNQSVYWGEKHTDDKFRNHLHRG